MKKKLLAILAFISVISIGLDAHPHQQPIDHKKVTCSQVGLEHGGELLYMTTSYSPRFSQEFLAKELIREFDNAQEVLYDNASDLQTNDFMRPKYDFGFSAFTTYSSPISNNKIGAYYSYIRNSVSNSINRNFDSLTRNTSGGVTTETIQPTIQNDRGKQRLHIHVGDLLFDHFFQLSPHFLLNLAAGMTGYKFHYFYSIKEKDQLSSISGNNVFFVNDLFFNSSSKLKTWGIGPKVGIEFKYLLFPKNWNYQFSANLFTNFSMLLSKGWENGSYNVLLDHNAIELGTPSRQIIRDVTWKDSGSFRFVPNLNLDFNLNLEISESECTRIDLTLGYKILSFWNFAEIKTNSKNYFIETIPNNFNLPNPFSSDLLTDISFSGGYFRLSISY